MAAEIFNQQEELLRPILKAHEASEFTLPVLRQPKLEWEWLKTLNRWLDTIHEWFQKHLSFDLPPLNLDFHSPQRVYEVILRALAVLVVLYLVVFLIRRFSLLTVWRAAPEAATPDLDFPDNLAEQLQKALAEGNLAQAARLRWLLFLERKHLPASLTPVEYSFSSDIYELMFGKRSQDRARYDALEAKLTSLEQTEVAGA